MSDRFPEFINRILSHEGEFTDNPKDKGNWTGNAVGKGVLKGTKFGIAANTYPNVDIKNLPRDGAIAIYRKDYWEKTRINELPSAIAYQVLDAAINHGPARAIGWLQSVVGATSDGAIGPRTLAAVAAGRDDPSSLALQFLAKRLQFYTDIGGWDTFGRGWVRRTAQNMEYAAND